MKIKKYDEFNEELSKKGLLAGTLAAGLAMGGIGAGLANMRDKQGAPTEQISSVKKEIPNNFQVSEKLLNIGHDFWITNDQKENFGKVEQRTLSFGKKFEYFDNTGKLSVVAQEKVFTVSTTINATDAVTGEKIGTIEQEILQSLGNILNGQNIYTIFDGSGNVIGKSKADMVIKNNVQIYDNSGNMIAKFHTPALSMGARWKCEVNSSDIDKRLLIFIPIYISSQSSSSSSSHHSRH